MRIAIGVEYNGAGYHGWQRQADRKSVQGSLEQALSRVADHPVELTCAGRTDRGVHALGQVAHFDTSVQRSARGWLLGANSSLPNDISITWVQPVAGDFHARFSATARYYRYVVLNRLPRPAVLAGQVCWFHPPLDVAMMQQAAQALVGEHDFTSYRAVGCQSKSVVRVVEFIRVSRSADFVYLDIKADAFLHHMVRNIAGVLLAVGAGKQPPAWVQQVLDARDRTQAGITAPAQGLYFVAAYYPPQFNLPVPPRPPCFSA